MTRTYKDLEVWQVAMDLAAEGYVVSRNLPASERLELASQLRRALVSVPSNIAEGNATGYRGQYAHHLGIALGSLGEIDTLVEVALRVGHLEEKRVASLKSLISRVGQMLVALKRVISPKQPNPRARRTGVH